MNYPKKEDYNVFKFLGKKNRKPIASLQEFLDFRFKVDPPRTLKYGCFFIPLFNYYNIIDLSKNSFEYNYLYLSIFISKYRSEILKLKELIKIKDLYLYKYQDHYGACCDDLAGLLFNNNQEKMIFFLKHAEIIDTILK
jgi:hypothetical protein